MTSNRPDAAPGSDQMFVMGTPCSRPTIPGDDVKFGAIRTQRRARAVPIPAVGPRTGRRGMHNFPRLCVSAGVAALSATRHSRCHNAPLPCGWADEPSPRACASCCASGRQPTSQSPSAASSCVKAAAARLLQCAAGQLSAADMLYCRTLYLSVDPFLRCRFNESTGVDYTQPCMPQRA